MRVFGTDATTAVVAFVLKNRIFQRFAVDMRWYGASFDDSSHSKLFIHLKYGVTATFACTHECMHARNLSFPHKHIMHACILPYLHLPTYIHICVHPILCIESCGFD